MSSVTDKTAQIRTAIYGKDVRENIASGLETIDSEITSNNLRQTTVEGQVITVNTNESARVITEASRQTSEITRVANETDRVNGFAGMEHSDPILEVSTARSTFPDLNTRLNNSDVSLTQKAYQDIPTSTIFQSGVDFGSLYFRIPNMITTSHGTIIAGADIRYSGMDDFGIIDNGSARSIDGGLTWINKQIIIHHNLISENSRVMDSCIIYNKALDKLFVFAVKLDDDLTWFTKTDKTNWDLVFVTSIDDGVTWSAETSIKHIIDTFSNRMLFLTGVGSGIVMANGTMILPVQCSNVNRLPFDMQSGFIYSVDNGSTWVMCQTLLPEYTSECNIVEIVGGGALLINARSDASGKRCVYRTIDMGVTWTPTGCNYVHSPNKLMQLMGTQASMIKAILPNGRQKIYYSAPHNLLSDRSNPSLMSSINNGDSWDMIASIYPSSTNGYTCLAFDGVSLYDALEINGDIIFKNISKLLNLAEKDIIMTQPVQNVTYTLYVSNSGNDNNTGITALTPLKTIHQALTMFNYTDGSNLVINLLNDNTENISLINIHNISSLSIVSSDGSTLIKVGSLNVVNCSSRLFFNLINFTGIIDATNANYLYNTSYINFISCTFSGNSSRLLYTAYCNMLMFTNPSLTKVGVGTLDGLYFDVGTVATIYGLILTNTGFRYGIYSNQSFYNLSSSVADGSIIEGSTSILTNATIPLFSKGISAISCNLIIGVGAYQNGWAVGTQLLKQYISSARKTSLIGSIAKGTGTLTTGTVLTTLTILMPRYTIYRMAIGVVTSGTIPVLIQINVNGNISLAQTISDSTLTSIIFDGITFDITI